jgi:dUTPase
MHHVEPHDRIAQLVVVPFYSAEVQLTLDELPDFDGRGQQGFGSSGR